MSHSVKEQTHVYDKLLCTIQKRFSVVSRCVCVCACVRVCVCACVRVCVYMCVSAHTSDSFFCLPSHSREHLSGMLMALCRSVFVCVWGECVCVCVCWGSLCVFVCVGGVCVWFLQSRVVWRRRLQNHWPFVHVGCV